jgi:hypothetical protein
MGISLEYDHLSREKIVLQSSLLGRCDCPCIFTEKEKISCLSLIKSREFDGDLGNEGLIDLYPINGAKYLVSRILS